MTFDHPQILINLLKAREVIASAPSEQLNLTVFRKDSACGTIACAAGWLAMNPFFAQMMKLVPETRAYGEDHFFDFNLVPVTEVDQKLKHGFVWLDTHFGKDCFDVIFTPRDCGQYDHEHPGWMKETEYGSEGDDLCELSRDYSDKELAIWRIDKQTGLVEAAMAKAAA